MSKREESRRDALLRADNEMRATILPELAQVAARRNTDFFMSTGSHFAAEARQLIAEAESMKEPQESLAAAKIVAAFAEAHDFTNEQRLGPIRLAERLLRELNDRPN